MLWKTCRLLFALLCMATLLVGCVSGEIQEGTQSQEEATSPASLHYSYPAWDFSLTFPETWTGRFEVRQDASCVTVSIDDTPTFSFVSLRNEEGAMEKDLRLEEDGYNHYCENGTHFFYFKILATLPQELYTEYQKDKSPEWHTEEAMYNCWQINWVTDICSVLVDGDSREWAHVKTDVVHK